MRTCYQNFMLLSVLLSTPTWAAVNIYPLDGQVFIKRGQDGLIAQTGQALQQGDQLLISEGGRALLRYDNGCSIKLRQYQLLDLPTAEQCQQRTIRAHSAVGQSSNAALPAYIMQALGEIDDVNLRTQLMDNMLGVSAGGGGVPPSMVAMIKAVKQAAGTLNPEQLAVLLEAVSDYIENPNAYANFNEALAAAAADADLPADSLTELTAAVEETGLGGALDSAVQGAISAA